MVSYFLFFNFLFFKIIFYFNIGGNVGDSCNIPLPSWVTSSNSDIWYQDQHGNKDTEYISLFANHAAVLGSLKRTPLQAYQDFMNAFKSSLCKFFFSFFFMLFDLFYVILFCL